LQKIADPLIAAFNKVCSNPRNQFKFLSPPERLAFVSMITSVFILSPLEFLVQFSLSDLTSIYCTLIDSYQVELISFNILPDNEVHLNWMLRAHGYSLQYGTSCLSHENYEYNIAQNSIDIVVRNFFHSRRLFRLFISDVLTLSGTSTDSSAQPPVFYEPLSDDHIHRLFCDDGLSVRNFRLIFNSPYLGLIGV